MDPFLGEIRAFSFGIIPRGWAPCNGQLLPINQNTALFSLLGNRYGGDGKSTFGLPDLRGRVGVSLSPQYQQGTSGGAETVTITAESLPQHFHSAAATTQTANSFTPNSGILAAPTDNTFSIYGAPQSLVALDPAAVGSAGGSQAHTNLQPYLAVNYCIALSGVYPSRQ